MQPSGREDAFDEGPASEPVVPQRDGPNHLHLSPPQQPFSSLAYAPYSPPPSASTSLPSFYQPNPLYSFPPLPDRRASYPSSGSPFLPSPPQTVGQLVQSMVSSTHQRRSSLPSSSGSFNSPENSGTLSPPGAPSALPFVLKLRTLVSQGYQDCVTWDDTGTILIMAHTSPRWKAEILPTHFGHTNYPSFTRQLNVYSFERIGPEHLLTLIDQDHPEARPINEYSAWRHPLFTRADERSSWGMRPRQSKARQLKKLEKEKGSEG